MSENYKNVPDRTCSKLIQAANIQSAGDKRHAENVVALTYLKDWVQATVGD